MIEWVRGGMDASGALNSNLGGVVAPPAFLAGLAKRGLGRLRDT